MRSKRRYVAVSRDFDLKLRPTESRHSSCSNTDLMRRPITSTLVVLVWMCSIGPLCDPWNAGLQAGTSAHAQTHGARPLPRAKQPRRDAREHRKVPRPAGTKLLRTKSLLRSYQGLTIPKEGAAKGYAFVVTAMGSPAIGAVVRNKGEIENKLIFSSLIVNKPGKKSTIGDIGLILEPGASSVAGTSPVDTAVQFSQGASTAQLRATIEKSYPPQNPGFGRRHVFPGPGHRHVPDSPAALMEKTNRGHNEILLLNSAESPVKVVGVFIRTDGRRGRAANDLASKQDVLASTAAARALGVPLVRIPTDVHPTFPPEVRD